MNATLKWILITLGGLALVAVLLAAGFFVGRNTWGWNSSPAFGYGGMMGGWGGYGPGMMGGSFGRGGFGPGMMGGWNAANLAISQDEALTLAEEYLAAELPQATLAGDVFAMHGFYGMPILIDGQFAGMLMVDGADGDVFLHRWNNLPADSDSN